MSAMWTLEEAVALVRKLEPTAIQAGYHLALGGSVLMAGQSDKDLDLFLYPHKTTECDDPERAIVLMGIYIVEERPHALYGDDKQVFECRIRDKRVDIFCLQ